MKLTAICVPHSLFARRYNIIFPRTVVRMCKITSNFRRRYF